MPATWLVGPLTAIARPAISAIIGDIWLRWRINRRYVSQVPSEDSPIMVKAISDLEILIGNNALLTSSVANILADLKSSGLIELIARDACYELDDPGIRSLFGALFIRHSTGLKRIKQSEASRKLYNTIRFFLRESIRAQMDRAFLFVFDTFALSKRNREIGDTEKLRHVMVLLRPDV